MGNSGRERSPSRKAVEYARQAQDKTEEYFALSDYAWMAHVRGDVDAADEAFTLAESLERELHPECRHLRELPGIRHADHCRRTGKSAKAREIAEMNLTICSQHEETDYISWNHRIIGILTPQPDSMNPRRHTIQRL